MESSWQERGTSRKNESTPEPPSPPIYSYNSVQENFKTKPPSRQSTTPPDYRSGRTVKNDSPQEKRVGKRSNSRSPSARLYRRSYSGDRERHVETDRDRDRGRDRDRDRDRDKDRDRDRDRDRHRDKDRSRRHSRWDRSKSKSRGRSRSRDRKRSRGRSRNRSRDRHRDSRDQKHRDSRRDRHRAVSYESDTHDEQIDEFMAQSSTPVQSNAFKNDGSFMEMFKKMQAQLPQDKPTTSVLEEKPIAPPPLMVGKRRGGRILKTGMVAKQKNEPTIEQPKDAWSVYMAEVRKYREVCCQEEDNTRPLVK